MADNWEANNLSWENNIADEFSTAYWDNQNGSQSIDQDDPEFIDASNLTLSQRNFKLSSDSPAIDAGSNTYSNYPNNDYSENSRENNRPDIGAYEFGGEAWTAGVDWEPKFYSTSWKINGISSDWFDPANWSSASVPTSDVNVIIAAGAAYYPVISSELAEAKNITINNSASLIINSGNELKVSGKLVNRGVIIVNSNSELTIH